MSTALAMIEATDHQTPQQAYSTGFSVREPLWRKAGNLLPEYPANRAEAKMLAGHDWEPVDELVYEPYTATDGTQAFRVIDGYKRIVRDDSGQTIGVSAATRATIGIDVMYDLVEDLSKVPEIKWEAGGTLGLGSQVWLLARLDAPITVPGDPSRLYPYLAVSNQIVGPGACSVVWTTVRSFSASSLSPAELSGGTNQVPLTARIRHTKNWSDRVASLEAAVLGVREQSLAFQAQATELAAYRMSHLQTQVFIDQMIPMPPAGLISDHVRNNIITQRAQLAGIYSAQRNAEIHGSAWGLVMAACEWLDHVKAARNIQSRFKRSMLKPEPMKRRSIELVRELMN